MCHVYNEVYIRILFHKGNLTKSIPLLIDIVSHTTAIFSCVLSNSLSRVISKLN